MDLTFLTNYLSPVILLLCAGVGYSLHSLNNKILDSFLPILSGTLGVIVAIWSLGTFDLPTIVTGLISGLAATGVYEAFKNMLNLPATVQAAAIEIPYGENLEDDGDLIGDHFAK